MFCHPPDFLNIWQRVEATWRRGSSRNAGPHRDVTSQRALLTPLARWQSARKKKSHPAPRASVEVGLRKSPEKNVTRSLISARARLFWPCSDQPESGLCWSSRAGDVPRDFRAVWFNLSLSLDQKEFPSHWGHGLDHQYPLQEMYCKVSQFTQCKRGTFKNSETLPTALTQESSPSSFLHRRQPRKRLGEILRIRSVCPLGFNYCTAWLNSAGQRSNV